MNTDSLFDFETLTLILNFETLNFDFDFENLKSSTVKFLHFET